MQLVYKQPQVCSAHITPPTLFPPGSEAAMEAAGSLAPIYPKVFSGRMVPRLEEELQSGRAGGLGKGVMSGFGVKPVPSPFGSYQPVGLCHMAWVGGSPWGIPSAGTVVLAQGRLCLVLATSLCGQDHPCGEELPSHRAGRVPWAWHGLVLLCCFTPSTLAGSGP